MKMGEKEKIRENYGKGRRNTGKTHVKEILIFTIGQEHILGGKWKLFMYKTWTNRQVKGSFFL